MHGSVSAVQGINYSRALTTAQSQALTPGSAPSIVAPLASPCSGTPAAWSPLRAWPRRGAGGQRKRKNMAMMRKLVFLVDFSVSGAESRFGEAGEAKSLQ